MDRLLRGEVPLGGKCDLKTLAAEAGGTRTGFYPKKSRDGTARHGTYQHLAEEFERRVKELQDAGQIVNPRAAQIERLTRTGRPRRRRPPAAVDPWRIGAVRVVQLRPHVCWCPPMS
ncbi:hypothetical protein ACIGW8_38740 [Streptomyces sioyaensis]|uniref:hypothetical protein n=1 Tax=Streptomyces sioyaensis TaxID=67364 RepID=UPI0037D7B6E5